MRSTADSEKREQQVAAILRAVEDFDLASSPAWSELDALSTHTFLDGIEVDPDGIIIQEKGFKAPLSVFVLLKYGSNSDDGFETSDSFMGELTGHFDEDGTAEIDDVQVDTTPFYEGEEKEEEEEEAKPKGP